MPMAPSALKGNLPVAILISHDVYLHPSLRKLLVLVLELSEPTFLRNRVALGFCEGSDAHLASLKSSVYCV